jgi:predicted RNA-binding protein YlxR (DUF448 family)
VGSDEEFNKHEAKRLAAVKAQDRADFTAEVNGTDNGRMKRFGHYDKHQQEKVRKEREKQALSRALKISASYATLYSSTMQNWHDASNAVYDAQVRGAKLVSEAQALYDQTVEGATKLSDDTAIFWSEDGSVYTQHERKLDEDELIGITQREGAKSWEIHQEAKSDLTNKQERLDLMNEHEVRLVVLQDEIEALKDHDTPENAKRFKAITEEISTITEDAHQVNKAELQVNTAYSHQVNETVLSLKGFEI